MNEEVNYFQDTKKKLKHYLEQRLLLLQLQATEKVSRIAATLVTSFMFAVITVFFLIFLSIAAGLWFGDLLGSYAAGFGIVTLFYLVVLLFVVLFFKKKLQDSFVNKVIQLLHKKD